MVRQCARSELVVARGCRAAWPERMDDAHCGRERAVAGWMSAYARARFLAVG